MHLVNPYLGESRYGAHFFSGLLLLLRKSFLWFFEFQQFFSFRNFMRTEKLSSTLAVDLRSRSHCIIWIRFYLWVIFTRHLQLNNTAFLFQRFAAVVRENIIAHWIWGRQLHFEAWPVIHSISLCLGIIILKNFDFFQFFDRMGCFYAHRSKKRNIVMRFSF